MLYETYEQKILKLKKIRDKILKYRFLILGILFAIFAVSITLAIMKGKINQEFIPFEQYTYGEEINCSANAFISNTSYEFFGEGYDGWSTEKPVYPGEYKVRTVGHGSFGTKKYGNEFTFTIAKKKIDIVISNTVIYGDDPTFSIEGLISGDVVTEKDLSFVYIGLTGENPKVKITGGQIRFQNSQGEDVTKAYDYQANYNVDKDISILQRQVEVTFPFAEKTYDGTDLLNEKYEITKGTLAYNDEILVDEYTKAKYFDENIKNSGRIRIFNENHEDVTNFYQIKKEENELKINKKEITLLTASDEKVYSGEFICKADIELAESFKLIKGDKFSVISSTSEMDVGEYDNVFKDFIITNGERDVTSCYQINFEYGKIKITPKPISISVVNYELIYDGMEVNMDCGIKTEGNLVDGHSFSYSTYYKKANEIVVPKNAGVYDCCIKDVMIRCGSIDKTKNYEINVLDGELTITKRPIKIVLLDDEKVYDALPFVSTKHEIQGDFSLGAGHKIELKTTGKIEEPGVDINKVKSVVIFDGTIDVTENYEIQTSDSKLTVRRRDIMIRPIPYTKIYDGKVAGYPQEFNAKLFVSLSWQKPTDAVYGSPLYGGCDLDVTLKVDDKLINVGESTISVDSCDIICGGESVLRYYNVRLGINTATVTPRIIEITSQSITKKFDGSAIVGASSDCRISKESLVPGHNITYAVEGKQLYIGESLNLIKSVEISDSNGEIIGSVLCDETGNIIDGNVGMNYVIYVNHGTLTIV